MNERWYFTAPWEPVSERRGDALGFGGGADYFANMVAPGLTNATYDARWISILSWCLRWSHVTWQKASGEDLSLSDARTKRYAWLRPLELLWVDRTLESGRDSGQLRGKNSIKRWRDTDCEQPNFHMSADQFNRYRQVGIYGAYRVIFRTIPNLTVNNDGWTPTGVALELATIINNSLPKNARINASNFDKKIQWATWMEARHAEYWITRGWPNWNQSLEKGGYPLTHNGFREELPKKESQLLRSILFEGSSDASIRKIAAMALANATEATCHYQLCEALADSNLKEKFKLIFLLPKFTGIADAAMKAMHTLWEHASTNKVNQNPSIEDLAKQIEELDKECEKASGFSELSYASEQWLGLKERDAFPFNKVVSALAVAVTQARTPAEKIIALSNHHQEYGGGRRWFQLKSGKISSEKFGGVSTNYRFRLKSLCRLAAQCGIAKMDSALDALDRDYTGADELSEENFS